jgi:hypothetical protein
LGWKQRGGGAGNREEGGLVGGASGEAGLNLLIKAATGRVVNLGGWTGLRVSGFRVKG